MLLGAMPEEGVAGAAPPTAKATRATDFSIAAIMARGSSESYVEAPPDRRRG